MPHLSACPVCQHSKLSHYLTCTDYTVSYQTFQLERCENCGFVLTNPRPDQDNLGKYYQSDAYISHSEKATNLIDQVYKISRSFTLRWKFNLINRHSTQKPQTLLDYGCGTGAFLQYCKKRNLKVAGVEPSSTAREHARQNAGKEVYPNLEEIQSQFDVITLWHVLEHVVDLHRTIDQLKNRLQQNGTMFIAVPNLQSQDATKYREHWAGYDVPRHLWHFSRQTMQRILTSHNLKLVNVLAMPLDSYYVSLLSEKYLNKSNAPGNILKAIHQGWQSNHAAKNTAEYSSLIYIVRK
jgi:2-polyprenyl-3-methyl-5-hydroxy-6-metoxy-1,4-benzoquinol methylase